ncbi:MAG: hypothetical protein ACFFFB_13475 [Candidatus Heimdallarchaeota archaeon]
MKKRNFKVNYIIIILLVSIFLSLYYNKYIIPSRAQSNGDLSTIDTSFNFKEFGQDEGEILNANKIEFTLPSTSWNFTDLEINFTDISYGREIFSVEDDIVGHSKLLNKGTKGYACQINITEPTEIYAIHLYGDENKPVTTTTVTVQINGYDTISDQPNNTVYGSTIINISSTKQWHIQNFASPIFLNIGYYYLVLNGTEMLVTDGGKLYFDINDVNPHHPNLYTWEYAGGIWDNAITGEPFLYKLDQKVLTDFYPSDINMSVDIGEDNYPISNGPVMGSGSLNVSLSYNPSNESMSIPILSNTTYSLIFNASYNIKLNNTYIAPATESITALGNFWEITPSFQREFDQYSVEFNYPYSWSNITVYRKLGVTEENVNSILDIDSYTKLIKFSNSTLINGAEWRIEAVSPRLRFDIILDKKDWRPNQTMQFEVIAPSPNGYLIFDINDPQSLRPAEFEPETQEVIPEGNVFSYKIPRYPTEGPYQIIIYWYNTTDGGIETEDFQINLPPPPFITPGELIIIISSIIVGTFASLISYRTYNNYKKKKVERAQKVYSQCVDSLNLNYLMVTDKKSGLNVYTQNFSEREIDAAMISGFLQAIHTFGIELMKVEDRSQTIKLEYRDSIILMSEFVNLRLILMMGESPSRFFLYSVEELAYDIYKNYGDMIDNFNGDIKPFKGIEGLLRRHLSIAFIYPLKLAKIEKLAKIRINQHERELIDKAVHYMKSNDKDYFYISSILPEKECSPKDVEAVLSLFAKGVFELFPM